jgi:hypothetical protein
MQGEFKIDLLCIIPFHLVFDNSREKYWRLLFLIKCLRIGRGNRLFEVGVIMRKIKQFKIDGIKLRIKHDIEFAEDVYSDNNGIVML